jgi:hypothetical protein
MPCVLLRCGITQTATALTRVTDRRLVAQLRDRIADAPPAASSRVDPIAHGRLVWVPIGNGYAAAGFVADHAVHAGSFVTQAWG